MAGPVGFVPMTNWLGVMTELSRFSIEASLEVGPVSCRRQIWGRRRFNKLDRLHVGWTEATRQIDEVEHSRASGGRIVSPV